MEPNITTRIDELEKKVDAIFISVEKTRKAFQITMWVTLIAFVLPLLAAMFILPAVINSYLTTYQGLL